MGNCSSDVKHGIEEIEEIEEIAKPIVSDDLSIAADDDDSFPEPNAPHALSPQIELSLSASNLRDWDIGSKIDPISVVYIKTKDGGLEEVGRTEVIMNSFEPSWIQKINITYHFEIVQPLIIRVYDVKAKYHNLPVEVLNLNDQDFIGEASCILSEILFTWDRSMTLTLHNNNGCGSRKLGMLTIQADEPATPKTEVEISLRCVNMEIKDLFSKSDRFLRISRILEDGGCIPICKTEIVNNSNLGWKPLRLCIDKHVTKENPLMLECFDVSSSGNESLVGMMHKSLAELEIMHSANAVSNFLLPASGPRDPPKVVKGQLCVNGYNEKQTYSFLDYLAGGCELNFMVAVDFTASNGGPRSPESLHYIDPEGCLNAYQQVITEVGAVIQYYNSDRCFPAWGFGGVTSTGFVSHCFNLSPKGLQVEGVEGIMSAYATALQNVILSGPTVFSQVINRAAQMVSVALSNNQAKYHVLLIITDGVVTDLKETKEAITRVSDLPLSIIIVGVGDADFENMKVFNAVDGKRIESQSRRVAIRDIVQFVSMRDVQSGAKSAVQACLGNLPNQFMSYVRSRNIKPLSSYGDFPISRKPSKVERSTGSRA